LDQIACNGPASHRRAGRNEPGVLLISYLFPPRGGSGVQRSLKLAKYLPTYGWRPHILTVGQAPPQQDDPSLLHQLTGDVVVHRAPCPVPLRVLRRPAAGPSGEAEEAAGGMSARLWQAARRLIFGSALPLARVLRSCLLIPDDEVLWLPAALRAGIRLLQERAIDVIFSTAGPSTNHLVGTILARETGLPLVADYRDPWTWGMHQTQFALRRWIEEAMERAVIQQAAAVTTVTQRFAAGFRDKYGDALGPR